MSDIFTRPYVTNLCINTLQRSKILYLPAASTLSLGSVLSIKDICGNAATSSIILSTTGYFDTIEYKISYTSTNSNIYTPSYAILSTNGVSAMLMPDGKTNWMVLQNNTSNPIYGRTGYSSFLYIYFYNLSAANFGLVNPQTSPLGPGNSGWFYPLFTSNASSIAYSAFIPPGNPSGANNWGFGAKGYIYSSTNTTIQFRTVCDDGMVVYYNNSTSVLRWTTSVGAPFTDTTPPLPLYAGYNPIKITFMQVSGGNAARFSWSIPAGGQFISNGTGVLYYNESSKYWP